MLQCVKRLLHTVILRQLVLMRFDLPMVIPHNGSHHALIVLQCACMQSDHDEAFEAPGDKIWTDVIELSNSIDNKAVRCQLLQTIVLRAAEVQTDM